VYLSDARKYEISKGVPVSSVELWSRMGLWNKVTGFNREANKEAKNNSLRLIFIAVKLTEMW
jgi:hypothetical protein